MKKNKIIAACMALFMSSFLSAAAKKSIVCTSFSEYDWTLNVLGEKVSDFEITLLQNNGTDLHSYQPSFKDIAKITTCDLFIYVGGESNKWVNKVILNSKNKNQIVVDLMKELGSRVLEEELVEGMQAEDDEEEESESDEHIWLSVKNAIYLIDVISDSVQRIDPQNKAYYKTSAEEYKKNLSALDSEYSKITESASKKVLLFADRFPFRYLTEDYGLNYFAAFAGCSAESEASFKTMVFLSNKVDELNLSSIIILEKSSDKIAQTVISNSKLKNQKILVMDSMQSVNQKEISDGKSYISIMKKNLEVLKQALK